MLDLRRPGQTRYSALLLIMCFSLFAFPFLNPGGLMAEVVRAAIFLVMIVAVWRISEKRWLWITVAVMGLVSEGFELAARDSTDSILLTLAEVSILLFLLLVAISIALHLWRTREVTTDTIFGAMAVYLLLGMMWYSAFAVLENHVPGSFTINPGTVESWETWRTGPGQFPFLLYFSFVTLTTLGFGDVTPATSLAAAMTITEAVTGQFFIAIMVARLVGGYLAARALSSAGGRGLRAKEGHRLPQSETDDPPPP